MKISTKSRYALRIMIFLAENYPLGYIPLKDIADSESLPLKYTEQLMSKLLKAGLVYAVRGNHGGYKLSKTPQSYSVNQIIKVMEIFKTVTPCAGQKNAHCPHADKCSAIDVWQLLQSTIDELLDNITLLDILKMQQTKTKEPSLYLTFLERKSNLRNY